MSSRILCSATSTYSNKDYGLLSIQEHMMYHLKDQGHLAQYACANCKGAYFSNRMFAHKTQFQDHESSVVMVSAAGVPQSSLNRLPFLSSFAREERDVKCDFKPLSAANQKRLMLLLLPLLLFLCPVALAAADPPFLFPHGYFDSNKIRPFDAIYLNLMAASNLEYGGTTLEELDGLDEERKRISRPEELPRNREEDDTTLDRAPKEGVKPEEKTGLKDGEAAAPTPKSPFSRIRLQRTLRDDPITEENEANPFEEIATRAPPRSAYEFQKLRKKLRHRKKSKRPSSKKHRATTTTTHPPSTSTVPPTLIPQIPHKFKRLPNNPYKELDMSHPNIIPLPVPPEEEEI